MRAPVIHDVSIPLQPGVTTWPGDVDFEMRDEMRISAGGECNVTSICMSAHTATHVDAPWHFVDDGSTVEALDLSTLIGPATVVDLGDASVVTPEVLVAAGVAPKTERLLLRTKNSESWHDARADFKRDYVALDAEAARWVVESGIRLIGVDYLSVQRFDDPPDTHEILLRSSVVIVEGLDLSGVGAGRYRLVCLPLKIVGSDGAPARAVLIEE